MESDNWCRERFLIDGFNEECNNIAASCMNVVDCSMSEIRFQTTVKWYLSCLYHIFCNPEPLGMEFNTVQCSIIGDLIFIEIYVGYEGMNKRKYPLKIGSTEYCTKSIM